MKRVGLLVVLCVLASAASAGAYDDRDYCLDQGSVERLRCRAEYLNDVAACADQRASDRWVFEDPTDPNFGGWTPAEIATDYTQCKTEAFAARTVCFAEVDTCQEE